MFGSMTLWFTGSALTDLLIRVTVLLALAWAVHSILPKHRPQWRAAAWRIFAISLICLPLLSVTIPKYQITVHRAETPDTQAPDSEIWIASSIAASQPDIEPVVMRAGPEAEAVERQTIHDRYESAAMQIATADRGSNDVPFVVGGTGANPPQRPSNGLSVNWPAVGFVVWLCGVLFILGRAAIQHRKTVRDVSASLEAEGQIQHICRRMTATVGCHDRVRVRVSSSAPVPYIYGWLRPVIVVPGSMAARLYEDDLPSVFAHELSHVRHNDLFWISMFQFLQALLWFHPLSWRMRSAHGNACEQACDEYASHVLGNSQQYTSTLARIALELSGHPFPFGAVPMVRASKIQSRLRLLMNGLPYLPLSRRWVSGFVMFWIVAVASVSVFDLAYAQTESGVTQEVGATEAGAEAAESAMPPTGPDATENVNEQIPPPVEAGRHEPQLMMIMSDDVRPSQAEEYMDATRVLNTTLARHGFPFVYLAFRSDTEFSYVIPVKSYADIDEFWSAINKVAQSSKGELQKQGNRANRNLEKSSVIVVSARPDLSYEPANPLFEPSPRRTNVVALQSFYVRPGRMDEAEGLIKDYIQSCREEGSRIGFQTSQSVFGEDGPIYKVTSSWKDREALAAHGKEHLARLAGLFPEDRGITRRVESQELDYVPTLSYFIGMELGKNIPGEGLDPGEIPPRDPNAGRHLVDLSGHYNAGLEGTWHTNTSVTPDSLKLLSNDLADLPVGTQKLSGVEFDVRGLIQLDGKTLRSEGGKYPVRVDGIPVGRKINSLHALHATGWQVPQGTVVGAYVLHHEDGSQTEIEIVYGKHVLDWWSFTNVALDSENTKIAWTGSNALARTIVPAQPQERLADGASRLLENIGLKKLAQAEGRRCIRLFRSAWDNPHPRLEVESIDFVSKMTDSAPFLVAITVE